MATTKIVPMAIIVSKPKQSTTITPRHKVAIIGGGISGLSCAQELSKDPSFDVTVYDTGRLRPGGRCSSRRAGDVPKDNIMKKDHPILSQVVTYDHAAQLLVKPNPDQYPAFAKQVDQWLNTNNNSGNVLQEYPPNSVGRLEQSGIIQPLSSHQTFYHGTYGMGSLATDMATSQKSFTLKQDVWVSPSSGVRYQKRSNTWKLQAKGETLGYYDTLILAHNGKCADRIMSKTPAKELHRLLRVQFSPTVPSHGGKTMTLNSLYSLTIVLPKNSILSQAIPEPWQCVMTTTMTEEEQQTHPNLRMISCQTRKYSSSSEYEVWNILSSPKFAKKYKAPQEFLPSDVVEKVTCLLLQSVQECFNLSSSSSSSSTLSTCVMESKLQLWGAAVPLNVWPTDYLWDGQYSVGVCGDWLVEPSIAGAWTSGYGLAQHLLIHKNTNKPPTVGLPTDDTDSTHHSFVRSDSANKLGLVALPQATSKT